MTQAQFKTSPATTSRQMMANAIRALTMDAVEKANSGHPGMPMGMADVATVLFSQFLKFNPQDAQWPDRDRFILSAGHGSMLLYSLLYLTGYPDMTLDQLKQFRQMGSKTAGHPEYGYAGGIETTTGPLGQGIANAVGFALAEKLMAARYGQQIFNHYTYVIAGDGCLMEGISQEAISMAGHWQLNKLIVLFDDNGISIDGPVSISTSEDQIARFKASGWNTISIDGHDFDQIEQALTKARQSDKPTMIACKTKIAFGAPTKVGTAASHGSPLGAAEIEGTRQNLGWTAPAFEIPVDVMDSWRSASAAGQVAYQQWQQAVQALPANQQSELQRVLKNELPANWTATVQQYIQDLKQQKPKVATRQSSQMALDVMVPLLPELIGGSADLTGSNNTKAKTAAAVKPGDFSGNYIHYGVREHGMAAAMNGLALHGGIIPFGGTFLVFTDYCRPSIRLSALMHQRVIYVMTHDSIGLGEDGPTHQPVEHLASLRAIPNLLVMRPADAVEAAECWQVAIETKDKPSILALTRQALPTVRYETGTENLSAKGGYILREAEGAAKLVIMATGSEVELALNAQQQLQQAGIAARVVSMPCQELFDAQSTAYQQSVLPVALPKIAVEAAIGMSWDKYLGTSGAFVGMNSFGASGPAGELYKHFGITAEAVVQAAKNLLGAKG